MKKLVSLLLAVCLCLGLALVPAAAAEAPTLAVQLNDQDLAFSDAVPQVVDQRTFLPFRAVFEALGAEVSYEGNNIYATRDDVSVAMVIGSTEVKVTRAGVAETITMDVAPYVDPATWRTYVPVRFAAQTLGCAVGWDQEAYTAVIIDPAALVAQAAEGLSFTKLEALNKTMAKFDEGTWNLALEMKGTAVVMDVYMGVTGTMTGTCAGNQAQISADTTLSAMGRPQAMHMDILEDLDGGKLYLRTDADDTDAWYVMDLPQGSSNDVYQTLADVLLSLGDPDSVDSYGQIKDLLGKVLTVLSDDALQLDEEGDYVSYDEWEVDGLDLGLGLALLMEDGETTAINLAVSVARNTEEDPFDALLSVYEDVDGVVDIYLQGVTLVNGMTTELNLGIQGTLTPGSAAPQVTPPAGVEVLPLESLFSQG